MGESRTDVALNVVKISGRAWALTVHKAAGALAHEPDADLSAYAGSVQAQAVREMDTEAVQALEAELRLAGIVDAGGTITRQWVLAVWISAFGPLRAAAVVQSADLSVHTELALAGGRGIGVTYSRRIRHGEAGVEVTDVRDAVEISFFAEEHAWAAIRRHLPDIPEVPGLPKSPAATAGETVAAARYTIHLQVSAHPAGSRVAGSGPTPSPAPAGAPAHGSWDVWTLTDHLYAVGTNPSGDGSALAPVGSDAIGREFAWRLLGAREYFASVAEQAA
ncbi:hypothetical protein [Pseudarthrobacter sp. DSP2-3-2b1]|uniref:hypothetical protein n=1 Tax=Pseudarthrobacter sp. DSP2-3-2b1 TaxID=2804661 RepID=UPI003CF19F30